MLHWAVSVWSYRHCLAHGIVRWVELTASPSVLRSSNVGCWLPELELRSGRSGGVAGKWNGGDRGALVVRIRAGSGDPCDQLQGSMSKYPFH